MATENPDLGIIKKQLSAQQEAVRTQGLATDLWKDAVELLSREGYTHTYRANVAMSIAFLPLSILMRLNVLYPLAGALKRFFQYDQATYICRPLEQKGLKAQIMLFADHGNPKAARVLQLGLWDTMEYLQVSERYHGVEAVVLCTEEDPRFNTIEPTINFHGSRFDGQRAKIVGSATPLELEDYRKLLAALKELDRTTDLNFNGRPWLKPAHGY